MGIKTLLFLVVIAHTCIATFNGNSVSNFEQTDEPNDDKKSSKQKFHEFGSGAPVNCVGSFAAITDNISTLDQAKLNSSLLSISKEAVDFLKGPMVTRIMPSFYIFIIFISLPLNALALVTFTCKIREKKPAVIYMSHLACVDLLFTLLLPLKIHYQLNASDWVFGEAACRVISAAYYCYMYCSILLMMCMSVDRLLAVVFPITSLTWRSTRKATYICVLVWLLAIVGTVPLLLVRQTVKIENVGITCHDVLSQNYPTVMYYVYLFFILSCLYFFVPLIITLVSYSTIIYALRVKSDLLATSPSSSGSRRRAVIMAIAVLTEFVLCFAPTNGFLWYHCYLLATSNNRGQGDSSYSAYLLAVCLGSTSVFLDPLLYYYGSSQSRQKISSVFRREKTTSPCNTQTKSTDVTKDRLLVKCEKN
ncbi:proteinase-activated receptor 1-like isoform X1 [Carassius carassius]|uniref:proteinase-activated receptor 1-like isoform X1 n=1 Tax=Carassius carassius TaxID=217509 RepID=UPI002869690D|nr:proteinase-activated receptor 1-like isoform X1 [Carassius carassius]